jgi:hypothetical protein
LKGHIQQERKGRRERGKRGRGRGEEKIKGKDRVPTTFKFYVGQLRELNYI